MSASATRRRLLLLAAAAPLVPGRAAANPAPGGVAAARPALGYGPIALGMGRDAALRALGPGAVALPLCGDAEGVLFDHADPALSPVPGRPVPAMAMFAGNRVSEMEASLSDAAGGRDEAAWRELVQAQLGEISRRLGLPMPPGDAVADPLGAARSAELPRAEGVLRISARWMRRSGASFTRLHWIAAGWSR